MESEAILGVVGIIDPSPPLEPSLFLSFVEPTKSNMSSPNREEVSNVVSSLGMLIVFPLEGGLELCPCEGFVPGSCC